jgi:hypothetical protein
LANRLNLSSIQTELIAPIFLRLLGDVSVSIRFEYSIDLFKLAIVLIDLQPLFYKLVSEIVSFILLPVLIDESLPFEATEIPFEREINVFLVQSLRQRSIKCKI